MVICHDQEPLMHGFYTKQHLEDFIMWHWQTWHHITPNSQILQFLLSTYEHEPFRVVELLNNCNRAILLHSELRSSHVDAYSQDGYLPVYYWSHAIIARDWFRYAQHDPRLHIHNDTIKFLVLSRAWSGTREYRLYVLARLVSAGLVPHCVVTFSAYDNGLHYSQHQWASAALETTLNCLEQQGFCAASDANSSGDYDIELMSQTTVDLILETLCDDPRLHLTEKTLRSLACGRPFLLLSCAGSLNLLRQYGFETFSPFLDESYDLEPDCKTRIDMVIKEMQRISNMPNRKKSHLVKQLYHIARRNKDRFFGPNFTKMVIGEYQTNMSLALDKIQYDTRLPEIAQLYHLVSVCPINSKILTESPHVSSRYRRLLNF